MAGYVVAITGASGSIYGVRLVDELLKRDCEVHLVISSNGEKVIKYELNEDMDKHLERMTNKQDKIHLYDVNDLFAPIASGSFKTEGMVIIPCSMSTIGEIAWGTSKSLIGRAADVAVKERRKLILVPRETPLSTIHLRNLLTLSEIGAVILPAMPGFYQKPKTIEDVVNFIVGRTLEALGIDNDIMTDWGNLN